MQLLRVWKLDVEDILIQHGHDLKSMPYDARQVRFNPLLDCIHRPEDIAERNFLFFESRCCFYKLSKQVSVLI